MSVIETARMARGILAIFGLLGMGGLAVIMALCGDMAGAVWPAVLALAFWMAGRP